MNEKSAAQGSEDTGEVVDSENPLSMLHVNVNKNELTTERQHQTTEGAGCMFLKLTVKGVTNQYCDVAEKLLVQTILLQHVSEASCSLTETKQTQGKFALDAECLHCI